MTPNRLSHIQAPWPPRLRSSALACLLLALGASLPALTGWTSGLGTQSSVTITGELKLVGADGSTRALLCPHEGGAKFSLHDSDGNERLALSVAGDGSTDIYIIDSAEAVRFNLKYLESSQRPKGAMSMAFSDSGNSRRLTLAAADHLSGFAMRDSLDRPRYVINQEGKGPTSAHFLSGDGEFELSLPPR